ncbi:MAG: nucleotidyltransferase domain-containing protein [Candidatus Omnitrophica bacterium]|nr:nucleotidyltransferase domain-containing protein [Candidatus Omnitrophota bacterium]MBU0896311.1 nucleotidyltransferase domain-containing protein [Candidatus Omnitrophota bacterium]MBU1366580.1 nucleotidyltransferase domain-containing protein [Candidatus Omnitrophota bacterium]MBU1523157.1 nucleotidyltransferase domain-containing protein [Candidatus Omnitrophota bacterium]MBU1810591.1 nucleotidyltransferase domain-containing protein [Candidatus Omnitrophota bacterium]
MAKKKNKKIDELIYRFAEELKKDIPIEKILLFGSYAQGKSKIDSDIDLIVVSPTFAKGKYIANMQYLFRKASKLNSLLEPIPAAPSEIKNFDRRVFPGQIIESAKVYNFM